MTLHYFMGYDHREDSVARVCRDSARYHTPGIEIHDVEHSDLRRRGLFSRPWRINEDGSMKDERDGKPFSTQFSHTRFLVPALAKAEGLTGWALFTDCDWLWLGDMNSILEHADPRYTCMVVKHNYTPSSARKMDGQKQSAYTRKLWSALTLWNLDADFLPTVDIANHADGNTLHRFDFVPDHLIGDLPEAYHWIADASPTTPGGVEFQQKGGEPVGVHFTTGAPVHGMVDRKPTPFDDIFLAEAAKLGI